MSEASVTSLACPACGADLGGPPAEERGGIRGGVPSPEEIHLTTLPHAERVALKEARQRGARPCAKCGETLYRVGGHVLRHRIASIFLPMHVAAARLRNHLRRLAITRVGPIEGDCYFLPYYRMEGASPEGDETFTLLAVRLGDERLERPFLPPADLRPFEKPAEGAAGPSGEGHAAVRVLEPAMTPEEAAERAEGLGFKAERPVELIHYPFYLMRVEDCGRVEGAWMDGIEAKLQFHRLRLAPPVPGRREKAVATLVPAAAAALAGAFLPLPAGLIAGAAIWAAGAPFLHAAVTRRWRG